MGIDGRLSELEKFKHECRLLSRRRFQAARDVYLSFLSLLQYQIQSEFGFLHLYDEETETVKLTVWSPCVVQACVPIYGDTFGVEDDDLWAAALRRRQTVIANEFNDLVPERHMERGSCAVTRYMCTPLVCDGKIKAVVGIANGTKDYSSRDARLFEEACRFGWPLVSSSIHRLRAAKTEIALQFEQLAPIEIVGSMLGAIGRALESRDEYTSHHQSNVAYLCGEIAEELKLDETTTFGLTLGAMVHDIGKISIPSQILGKPGRLTMPEYELLKTHAETGANFFTGFSLPWPIRDMILQHHERMDGSGYPHGITGYDICLEARVIAVADTYDAMASDRPYRKTVGAVRAIEQIKRDRGVGLDPYVVDAFLRRCAKDPTFDGRYTVDSVGDVALAICQPMVRPDVLN